ncbi:Cytochrome c oxidase assembly protein cox19 [Physocladia obscura]|uniref:Cytochrome c oxidase assembly protein cox19 n=1 Tax=Physocladia obscura TaxID=109957 RepID=A0AAD5TAN6_9FUNG|nr:Cytochrome c oxidase assembly protein cox19 [Physocladia obscura]
MSMGNSFQRTNIRAIPPERGAFPLDIQGLCKGPMEAYMKCMNEAHGQSANCRELSRIYIECRMQRKLMEPDRLENIGFTNTNTDSLTESKEKNSTTGAGLDEKDSELLVVLSPSGSIAVCFETTNTATPAKTQHSDAIANTSSQLLRVSVENAPLSLKKTIGNLRIFQAMHSIESAFKSANHDSFTRWPLPYSVVFSRNSTEITSLDNSTAILLSDHRQSICVNISLPKSTISLSFSILDVPYFWVYPVKLLLQEQSHEEVLLFAKNIPGCITTARYVAIPIPTQKNCESLLSSSSNTSFNPSIHSLAVNPIQILETEQILYRVILSKCNVMVEAIIKFDNTIFRSTDDFAFLTVYTDSIDCEIEMYSIENPPEYVSNHRTGIKYPLSQIVFQMTRLYHLSYSEFLSSDASLKNSITQKPSESEYSLDHIIDEISRVSIPSVGTFCAFSDGSVRGEFEKNDISIEIRNARALSIPRKENLNLDGMIATVTDQHGSRFDIRVFKPIGFEQQMESILQYIDWVFMDEYEREKMKAKKEAVNQVSQIAIKNGRRFLSKLE